jgi:hypothetical protein
MSLQELQSWWTTVAGGDFDKFEQKGGFCEAVCQCWVSERLQGKRPSMKNWNDSDAFHTEASLRQSALMSTKIPGTKREIVAKRRDGTSEINGRDDLLNEIFTHRGCFTFTARGFFDAGHSLAFDTRGPLFFMDPNTGQYRVDDGRTGEFVFREFFKQYWEQGYGNKYASGDRILRKYTMKDINELIAWQRILD